MASSGGQLTLSELQSSSYYSEKSSPLIPISTDREKRHGHLLFLPLRVLWVVIRSCAWLALLGVLHSVILWVGILLGYFVLRFSLSRLRDGTPYSLGLMLWVLLRWSAYGITALALWCWQHWPYFTLKRPYAFLALGLWGAIFLYEWTLLCLEWGL